VLKEVRCPSDRDLAAASQEARLLSSLDHPNIIKYIESQQQGKTLYIVMELAKAGDLGKKLGLDSPGGGRRLSEGEVMYIFAQVVMALDYLHERRILHRDLKPANIFMMSDSYVKLGDFGIAKVLASADDLTATIIGTPGFLSPEMYKRCRYGSKADVWALGCVLYTMCTLWPPVWPKGRAGDPQRMVLNGSYSPISAAYSEPLRKLVARMLSMNPNDRPSVRQILGMALLRQQIAILQPGIPNQNAPAGPSPAPPQPDKKPNPPEEAAAPQKAPNTDPHWHGWQPQKPEPAQPQPVPPTPPTPPKPPVPPRQLAPPKQPGPPMEAPELGQPPDKRPPLRPAVAPGPAWAWDDRPFPPPMASSLSGSQRSPQLNLKSLPNYRRSRRLDPKSLPNCRRSPQLNPKSIPNCRRSRRHRRRSKLSKFAPSRHAGKNSRWRRTERTTTTIRTTTGSYPGIFSRSEISYPAPTSTMMSQPSRDGTTRGSLRWPPASFRPTSTSRAIVPERRRLVKDFMYVRSLLKQ
jgi:serine/threonine protein kinase